MFVGDAGWLKADGVESAPFYSTWISSDLHKSHETRNSATSSILSSGRQVIWDHIPAVRIVSD